MSYVAELRKVTKTFDEAKALDDVSLQIMEGEILGILGPNGSGKTTLLRILGLIQQPTKGEVYFQGVKITGENIEQMRLDSTMVFQRVVLFNSTVYGNIAYGMRIRRIPKDEVDKRVERALRLVKLEGLERRRAKKLSGGEQQRVALARALVLNTRLLLLDEPTANLDPKSASIIEEAISEANRETKTTIVIATHNMLQAKNLPQRIALMENGKIGEIGGPAEFFGKLSKTLAKFAAVENTFAGTARATEGGTTVIDVGNGIQLEATGLHNGATSVFVNPEDIVMSKKRFDSSARNVLRGKIVEILSSDSLVRLKVDVGKPFAVQITRRSFIEMELNLNSEVFLSFKASSVQTI
jgi:tungstate transport system ATP-binding protein